MKVNKEEARDKRGKCLSRCCLQSIHFLKKIPCSFCYYNEKKFFVFRKANQKKVLNIVCFTSVNIVLCICILDFILTMCKCYKTIHVK